MTYYSDATMNTYDELEISVRRHRSGGDQYAVEMRLTRGHSDDFVSLTDDPPPLVTLSTAMLEDLQLLRHRPKYYGNELGELFFAHPALQAGLDTALNEAARPNMPLRLRLILEASAAHLHAVFWETICHPAKDTPLAPGGRVLFSRFPSVRGARPPRLAAQASLSALIVAAGPSDLDRYPELAPVAVEDELQRACQGLGLPEAQVVALGRGQASLGRILDALQQGPDIFYLLAHGTLKENEQGELTPYLWLEDDQGKVARVAATELIAAVERLPMPPRLAILTSCQSASSADRYGGALAALGPGLATAGVPAVVAMQGLITIETAGIFVAALLANLRKTGLIDEAVAVARNAVFNRQRDDWWSPALFSRLRSGRLWQDVSESALADRLHLWLQRDGYRIVPGDAERLLGAVSACPSAASIPYESIGGIAELLEQLRELEAGTPHLAALDRVLEEVLPQTINWAEVAELQKIVRGVSLFKENLRWLHGRCAPPGGQWALPEQGESAGLLPKIVRQLAAAPIQEPGHTHPLVNLVRLLLGHYRHELAVEAELQRWATAITARLRLSAPDALGAATPGHPQAAATPYLLIQIDLAGRQVQLDLSHAKQIQVRLDAWIVLAADQAAAPRRLWPFESSEEAILSLAQVADCLPTLMQRATEGLGQTSAALEIEVFLPRDLLLLGVDMWELRYGEFRRPPLGSRHRVAVRPLDRITKPANYPRSEWQARWARFQALKLSPIANEVKWLVCVDDCTPDQIEEALLDRAIIGLIQLVPPEDLTEQDEQFLAELLDMTIAYGIPAAIFTRERPGDLEAAHQLLQRELERRPGGELPDLVLDQRYTAFRNRRKQGDHIGNYLTLLWDDPGRIPPPITYEEPSHE